MTVKLAKSSIDLGIVVADGERAMAFYCGVLGFEHVMDMPMPGPNPGTMYRVMCGESLIKLVCLDDTPPAATPGGIPGGLGYRYATITVENLDEVLAACDAAGVRVIVPATTIREGVTIGMVEDPDRNWVEFIELS